MAERKEINGLDDFFNGSSFRVNAEAYFCRICGYNDEIGEFLKKYYLAARRSGAVIEGRLKNPDEKNLAYYNEILGAEFEPSEQFISDCLAKWTPRLSAAQTKALSSALNNALTDMARNGKSKSIIKNAYVKLMCWLYYRFERAVSLTGKEDIPKILYDGEIGVYELYMLKTLSEVGCDVVIINCDDDVYLPLDPTSAVSHKFNAPNLAPFPKGYGVKSIIEEIDRDESKRLLYGNPPRLLACVNAWIDGVGFADILKKSAERGTDPRFFYNCFYRINGAEDKTAYLNELILFKQKLKTYGRRVVALSGEIPKPSPEEIAEIKREPQKNADALLLDLAKNIDVFFGGELAKIIRKAFIDVMLDESDKKEENINRLTSEAVYALCWLKRYGAKLFSPQEPYEIGCFIYMGGYKTQAEAAFLSLLARTPVDTVILRPNLEKKCLLNDDLLYELNYAESLDIETLPDDNAQISVGTAAYRAEREFDALMYSDAYIYGNKQYSKANAINLRTIQEEIKILWDEELRYRPGFSIEGDVVNTPVIFAKESGVKDRARYWSNIKELITPDAIVIERAPYICPTSPNPFKAFSAEFYKNGVLQKEKIKNCPKYRYGILREDIQEHILDKLSLLIERKLIKGVGENGTEFAAIALALNMPKEITRGLQKFDFTKKNPKFIYINTSETEPSLEDAILTAYLNLLGFDVIFFAPAGYRGVEKYFNGCAFDEHRVGEYIYDMQTPKLNGSRLSLREKLFGKRD